MTRTRDLLSLLDDNQVKKFMEAVTWIYQLVYCFNTLLLMLPEDQIGLLEYYSEQRRQQEGTKVWPPELFDNLFHMFPLLIDRKHWIFAWFDVLRSSLYVADPLCSVNMKTKEVVGIKVQIEEALSMVNGKTHYLKVLVLNQEYVIQQKNDKDCGYHICAFAALVARMRSLRSVDNRKIPILRKLVMALVEQQDKDNLLAH